MSPELPADPARSFDSKAARLRDRAFMLKAARRFFDDRGICEVDCPALSAQAPVETHIDLIPAIYLGTERRYLHSSPEMGMKRLLAEGMGDIYQLSHVFRDGEWSSKHNPEFSMAEWYRLNFTLPEMIEETVAFIRLFLGPYPHRIVSYRALFLEYTGLDPLTCSTPDLIDYIQYRAIPFYRSILEEGKDALLHLILGSQIEALLGQNELLVLSEYPASQASLARQRGEGAQAIAERFEVYFQGVELANGFHELTDAAEQRQRFQEGNQARVALGKAPLPPDERFLRALEKGLPDCCGVAVGFDRLMMLRQNRPTIADILAWDWSQA